MLKAKWNLQKILNACRHIQRVYRGHKAREIYYKKIEEENIRKELRFFHAMATIIQKQ